MTLFVSFYTAPYHQRALRLMESLRKLALNYCIRRRDYSGTFVEITNKKAEFLIELRDEFAARRLVWLDSDLIVYQRPNLLMTGDWDVAYVTRPTEKHGISMMSGVVGIGSGAPVVHMLNAWKRNAERFSEGPRQIVDDETFKRAVKRTGGLTRLELPSSYFAHHVYTPERMEDPVIGQPKI